MSPAVADAPGPASAATASQAASQETATGPLLVLLPTIAPPNVMAHEQATKAKPRVVEFTMTIEEKKVVIDEENGITGDTRSDSAYKADILWEINDIALVRASYQRAVRAHRECGVGRSLDVLREGEHEDRAPGRQIGDDGRKALAPGKGTGGEDDGGDEPEYGGGED